MEERILVQTSQQYYVLLYKSVAVRCVSAVLPEKEGDVIAVVVHAYSRAVDAQDSKIKPVNSV